MLNKQQILSIFGFIVLFLLLFFGCDKKSKKHLDLEKSRSKKVEIISIDNYIHKAHESLLPEQRSRIDYLNNELSKTDDSLKYKIYESLASDWYQMDHPLASAFYANKIAETVNTEQAWSIAGTTFALAQKKNQDLKEKLYAQENAISAFEKASSLNPDNINHKINLALTYVENPPKDNPMKGVLMMVDLNKKNPNNVKVLSQLGKLSIQTNQIDKAISRFEQILAIEPENKEANCTLADLLSSQNRTSEAQAYLAKCK